MREQPSFPYFVPTPVRSLTPAERSVLERLLEGELQEYRAQAQDLRVVGRCGCGKCPTVFFEPHFDGDCEANLVSYSGRDGSGGVVGVLLFEKSGRLSQLEFFSADGHEPWGIPAADTLERY